MAKDPEVSGEADLCIDALLYLCAKVSRRRPLERELDRLNPQTLPKTAREDLEHCQRIYQLVRNEIDFIMDAYLAAIKAAETEPTAPLIAHHILGRAVELGRKDYERWIETPQAQFDGLLPRAFLESKGLHNLADILLR